MCVEVVDGKICCKECGEILPEFLCFPGLCGPFVEGYAAAKEDMTIGANPYWFPGETTNCFAVAGWNLGWLHVVNFGNKMKQDATQELDAQGR